MWQFYLHTAFKMYMYNCKWQKQNMTEIEPKQVIGRRMSIQKMQFRCTPRGTTQFLHESIDKNLLYKNPLFPKRNRCTIWINSLPKFAIFALRNVQTAIVFVGNAHAHVS